MISVHEIINEMVLSGEIDRLLSPFTFSNDPDLGLELRKDFKQDMLLYLLTYKKPDKIMEMYAKGQLGYFILRIIKNNLLSHHSRYYYNYIKWEEGRESIDEMLYMVEMNTYGNKRV